MVSIDEAHRKGYVHAGHVVAIVDAAGLMLFLRRADTLVTCPGTWSTLGEHAVEGEDLGGAVRRAVWEELGVVIVDDGDGDGDSGNVGDHSATDSGATETVEVSIRNMTEHPLYYIRHYGPSNANRIDRQPTYLWLVQLRTANHADVAWKFDDEVADHKWITMDEFEAWLAEDRRGYGNGSDDDRRRFADEDLGGMDDGASKGDFCHDTIRSLYQVLLDRCREMVS